MNVTERNYDLYRAFFSAARAIACQPEDWLFFASRSSRIMPMPCSGHALPSQILFNCIAWRCSREKGHSYCSVFVCNCYFYLFIICDVLLHAEYMYVHANEVMLNMSGCGLAASKEQPFNSTIFRVGMIDSHPLRMRAENK